MTCPGCTRESALAFLDRFERFGGRATACRPCLATGAMAPARAPETVPTLRKEPEQ